MTHDFCVVHSCVHFENNEPANFHGIRAYIYSVKSVTQLFTNLRRYIWSVLCKETNYKPRNKQRRRTKNDA